MSMVAQCAWVVLIFLETQVVFKENSAHWSENIWGSLFKVPPPDTYNDDTAVTNHSGDAQPSQEFWRSQDSQVGSAAEDISRIASNAASSEVLNVGNSISQPLRAGSKSVLSSISVTKPGQQ